MKKYILRLIYSLLIIVVLFVSYKAIIRVYNCCFVRTHKFENGTYVGKMDIRGKRCGKGIYTFSNGDRYEGEFSENEFSGEGIYYFADESVYEGEFRNSDFNGFGKYSTADGYVYIGEHKDNRSHGYGKYYFGDSLIREGMWSYDKFISEQTIL
jgi:hypothetical protein